MGLFEWISCGSRERVAVASARGSRLPTIAAIVGSHNKGDGDERKMRKKGLETAAPCKIDEQFQ